MSYAQKVREHVRVTILRLLEEDPNYTMNDSLITDLVSEFALSASRDTVRTELAWLREQGLVTFNNDAGIIIATLTERGADVALGRATVPGIKRPSPRRP